jgi:hypothetical protein
MTKTIIILLSLAFPALATWPNDYPYRRAITVQAAQVPSTQTDFPMLISGTYSYLATVANGGKVQAACNQTTIVISVGCDLIFTSDAAGSTLLSWEFETYNATTGAVNIWVKVPSIANGTVIYMFYGKAGVAAFLGGVNGTWNSAYKSVWHLPDGSSLAAGESTSNANTGTVSLAVAGAGKIDGAASFSGTAADKVTAASTTANTFTGDFTVSLWVNWTSSALAYQNFAGSNNTFTSNASFLRVWGTGEANAALRSKIGIGNPTHDGSSAVVSNASLGSGAWTYVVAARTSNVITLYINGAVDKVGAADSSTYDFSQGGTCIGNSPWDGVNGYFKGLLDEVRLSNSARSADWIAAEYNNQFAPSSFYAVGEETLAGGASLIIARLNVVEQSWAFALRDRTLLAGMSCNMTAMEPGETATCKVTLTQAPHVATEVTITIPEGFVGPSSVVVAPPDSSATFKVSRADLAGAISTQVMTHAYSIWPRPTEFHAELILPCCAREDRCGLSDSMISWQACSP